MPTDPLTIADAGFAPGYEKRHPQHTDAYHLHASDPHDLDLTEPKQLPDIVRDVQADMAAHKCCDCGNPLENEATIHLHLGGLYCSRCYNAEAGS